ncbi:hypothetical protein HID58_026980, partial [Brassica napus]
LSTTASRSSPRNHSYYMCLHSSFLVSVWSIRARLVQLPANPSAKLCNIPANSSSCSSSPANPVAQVASRHTSFMGLGYGLRSSSSKSEIQLIIPALATILPGSLLI